MCALSTTVIAGSCQLTNVPFLFCVLDPRCAGVCDDDTGTCYCDGPDLGRIPAPLDSPPGTPPIREGRLLQGRCQRPETDALGEELPWVPKYGGRKYADIYGPLGWCVLQGTTTACPCDVDGYDGRVCELRTEMVCANQCSGHGGCQRGFCKCFFGWYGADCAKKSKSWKPYVPNLLGGTDVDGGIEVLSNDSASGNSSRGSSSSLSHAASSSSHGESAPIAAEAGAGSATTAAVTAAAVPTPPLSPEEAALSMPEEFWGEAELFAARPWLRNVTKDVWAHSQPQTLGFAAPVQLLIHQGLLAKGDEPRIPDVYREVEGGVSSGAVDPIAAAAAASGGRRLRRKRQRQLQRHFWTGGGNRLAADHSFRNVSIAGLPPHVSGWLAGSNVSGLWEAEEAEGGSNQHTEATEAAAVLSAAHGSTGGEKAAEGPAGEQLLGTQLVFADVVVREGLQGGGMAGMTRRRPLIYVYDMPAMFVSRMMQYRSTKDKCTWRTWTKSNWTNPTGEDSGVKRLQVSGGGKGHCRG